MTLADLKATLEAVFPGSVTFTAWPVGEAPDLPYICLLSTGSDNFAADNVVYHSLRTVRVELYSALKDLPKEEALESALTAAGLYWDRDESYIADERVYLTIYEVEING